MIQVTFWYILLFLLGLAAWPITTYIFPALSDKGYAFSKSLGLFLWGFIYWLLCTFGILQNNLGGAVTALIIILLLSLLVVFLSKTNSWSKLWSDQKKYALIIEMIFMVSFIAIALWRASNPDIVGTEKPMELAFINAILKKPIIPSHRSMAVRLFDLLLLFRIYHDLFIDTGEWSSQWCGVFTCRDDNF